MKRLIGIAAFLLCVIWTASCLGGCARKVESVETDQDLHIYASFYPFYAIMESLMQNVPDAYVHCLVQPQDGCLRDYQLSDWDLSLLEKSADMVIIGGRGMESFEQTLYALGEEGPAVAAVLYNRELAPGITEGDFEGEENHWQGENPHLYMDAEGAILIAEGIAAQLMVADPANSELYMQNLEEIDNRLRSVCDEAKGILAPYAGEKVILMNETAVYIAQAHDLEVEKCVMRDSGEAYYDYELDKVLNELEKCESRVILIEKQAPERFCEALEAAGFTLAKIDTMSAIDAGSGSQAYFDALIGNAEAVAAAFDGLK